jgi:hypothetical protein
MDGSHALGMNALCEQLFSTVFSNSAFFCASKGLVGTWLTLSLLWLLV